MAVHHETFGAGKEIARAWSKQGVTYDEDNFNLKWDSFDFEEVGDDKKPPFLIISFASLFCNHKNLIPQGLFHDRFTDAYNKDLFSIINRGHFLYNGSLGGWFVRKVHLWLPTDETKEPMLGKVARFLTECKQDGYSLKEWTEEERGKAIDEAKMSGKTTLPKSPREQFFASYKAEKVANIAKAKSTLKALEAGCRFHIEADNHYPI